MDERQKDTVYTVLVRISVDEVHLLAYRWHKRAET